MAFSLFIPQGFLQTASYITFATGLGLFFYKLPTHHAALKKNLYHLPLWEKRILIFSGLFLLSFFISATILKNGGNIQDAMVYHLQGPKEWALFLNGAKFNLNNPIPFTTSYFDYYYYFLFLLTKPFFIFTSHLISTEYEFLCYTMLLSAQIFSGIIAIIYIPYLIIQFTTTLGMYKYLAIFFIFGLRLFTWSWVLPKNDVFPFLCFLFSIYLFQIEYINKKSNKSIKFLFLSSLILGIGTASKLTNAYIVIFSLLFTVVFYFAEIKSYLSTHQLLKSFSIISIGLGLGASVFLFRNYFFTGNPFFPTAKFGFPNIYISEYANRPALYSDPTNWFGAITKIKLHLLENPPIVLLLLLSLVLGIRIFPIFYLIMVIFMSKQTGPMYSFRMTNFFLVLDLILYFMMFKKLLARPKFMNSKLSQGFLILFILIYSKIQFEKFIKYPLLEYPKTVENVIKDKVDFWNILLKTNIENKDNPHFVFSPEKEIFPYFSRFPFISQYDSVPKYRYNYFKDSR